jgi:hypothetical protein
MERLFVCNKVGCSLVPGGVDQLAKAGWLNPGIAVGKEERAIELQGLSLEMRTSRPVRGIEVELL